MDILNFLNFSGINIAVFISSILISLRLEGFKVESIGKLLISSFVLFFSQILLIQFILGSFGILNYLNISICSYLLFSISALSFGKKAFNFKVWNFKKLDLPDFSVSLLIFAPILFLLIAKFFNAALQIPLEYDSVAYHLPFISEWLQTGSLLKPYYSAFAGPISYYPSNYELFDLWSFLPFRNDFFANLLNFPLFGLLGMMTWKILRNFKIDKLTAIFATAIPFYMPVFLTQAGMPLVDLFFTISFAFAFYYLQEIYLNKDLNLSDFLLFGLSLGLFIGTKYLGLVYASVLIFAIFICTLFKVWNKKTEIFKYAGVAIFGLFLTGSFFYFRNWFDSGNPLFPVNLSLFGFEIFEGYKGSNQSLLDTSLLANSNSKENLKSFFDYFYYLASPMGIISIFIPIILFFQVGLNAFLSRLKKTNFKDYANGIYLALFGFLFFMIYLKAPYTFRDLAPNIRYAMPFLLIGTFSIAYTVDRMKFLKPIFYFLMALYFAYFLLFGIVMPPEFIDVNGGTFIDLNIITTYKTSFMYLIASILSLFFFIQISFFKFKKFKLKAFALIITLLCGIGFQFNFLTFSFEERENLTNYWIDSWFSKYQFNMDVLKSSIWLNQNLTSGNIAYSGFNFHYHYFGRNFKFKADYVNINECLECRYVDYKKSKDSIRRDPNFENWFSNLEQLNKNYLVVNPNATYGVRSYEYEWAKEFSDKFELVFQANDVYIFKIKYDK
ncbi:hypothetical protein CL656_00660 [bacterium]|nr:hypothetical protein [bacterium]